MFRFLIEDIKFIWQDIKDIFSVVEKKDVLYSFFGFIAVVIFIILFFCVSAMFPEL
jgi:hypothetical protein